ncbi:hypothetical protein B0H11DRAFT_1936130 [Mycena galericulata]|nr:hypothetical protein B0H11DRAFT_1936130 [Mycena galericulata]
MSKLPAHRRHQIKGENLRLHKASRRSLESWANHYGFKHLADELPLRERADFYRARLYEVQKEGKGPFFGQRMKRLPMSQSDWPNKRYKAKIRIKNEKENNGENGTETDVGTNGCPSRTWCKKKAKRSKVSHAVAQT